MLAAERVVRNVMLFGTWAQKAAVIKELDASQFQILDEGVAGFLALCALCIPGLDVLPITTADANTITQHQSRAFHVQVNVRNMFTVPRPLPGACPSERKTAFSM
jgi:hypothetical protein